jgi:hypothetical protein
LDLTGAFNFGVSYTYSTSITYTVTEMHTRTAGSTSECGYFTFVPYYLSSCGTLTSSDYEYTAFVGGTDWECSTDNLHSTANWCNSTPYTVNGEAQGEVIWVDTVCGGGGLAPLSGQQPIYQEPGVSLGTVPGGV